MNDLMQKLMISKAIMDKHDSMGRASQSTPQNNRQIQQIQEFEVPTANYNIPESFIKDSKPVTYEDRPPTKDRILNSKLPDEIKKLMIENPIAQVNPLAPSSVNLSDEMIEKATKLMGNSKKELVQENKNQQKNNLDTQNLKKIMREVVEEVLHENGLILESTSNTNEAMVIKVGKHIFEGRISKIKKTK